jgi:hypothetical protein
LRALMVRADSLWFKAIFLRALMVIEVFILWLLKPYYQYR